MWQKKGKTWRWRMSTPIAVVASFPRDSAAEGQEETKEELWLVRSLTSSEIDGVRFWL